MKQLFIVAILFLSTINCFAQKAKADSIQHLLNAEKQDTSRVKLMWKLADVIYTYNPDTASIIASNAITLARAIKYLDGESRSLGVLANAFLKLGNYSKALEHYLEKLKLEEKRNVPRNLASVTMNIGITYVFQEEYKKGLPYYLRADSIINKHDVTDLKYNIALNIGDLYDRMNLPDSAYQYFAKAHSIAIAQKDNENIAAAQIGIAHYYQKQHKTTLAIDNYKEAIHLISNNEDLICEGLLGIAKTYQNAGKTDSAILYARQSLRLAEKDEFQSRQLDAASFLLNHYRTINNTDSAFVFLLKTQAMKDSINSKERIRESQLLSMNETIRQREIEASKVKANKERKQQLQLLFIGIFIPAFFIITLLLSRIQINARLIKFMGIISLLIFFEYLTLLLHPTVVELTHHTPWLEMLIFVTIAAFLIPAHHKLEQLFIAKITNTNSLFGNRKLKVRKLKQQIKNPDEQQLNDNAEHQDE